MTTLKQKPRKTIDDFRSLPDETRAELIEGEILMTPSPMSRQARTANLVWKEIDAFIGPRKLGIVYAAPLDVYLATGDVVQPDVIWVSSERSSIVGNWIHGAPDLVVEVLSPTSRDRDRFVKKELYARSGIREYWIVDSDERTVEVFTLKDDNYEPAGYFTGAATLRSPALPGLEVPLARIFE